MTKKDYPEWKISGGELCTVDARGVVSDASIHEEILNNEVAQKTIAELAVQRAVEKQGMSQREAELLYGYRSTAEHSIDAKKLRLCLCEPIPQIAVAAQYLSDAEVAHREGKHELSQRLIQLADIVEIRKWLKPIWANSRVHVKVQVATVPMLKELRAKARMPNSSVKALIHKRDGYNCRFCCMPVIRRETRSRIMALYPSALYWGAKEKDQHAAFQAMWAQYDHIVPHSLGGASDLENMVLTCAACNFGRAEYSLEQVAVEDPRIRPPVPSSWNGLENFK